MHRRHLLKLSRTGCGWCGKNQAATSVRFTHKAPAHHKQDGSLYEESRSGECLKANNSSGELKVACCSISQKSGIRPKQPSASNSCSHFNGAKISLKNERLPEIAHHCLNKMYLPQKSAERRAKAGDEARRRAAIGEASRSFGLLMDSWWRWIICPVQSSVTWTGGSQTYFKHNSFTCLPSSEGQ